MMSKHKPDVTASSNIREKMVWQH